MRNVAATATVFWSTATDHNTYYGARWAVLQSSPQSPPTVMTSRAPQVCR